MWLLRSPAIHHKRNNQSIMKRIFLGIFLMSGVLVSFNNTQTPPIPGFGVALYSFSGAPFETALKKADSTGCKYVQGFSWMSMGADFGNKTLSQLSPVELVKAKKLLEKYKLTMPSIYVQNAGSAEEWKHHFEMGKALGAAALTGEPVLSHLDMIDTLAEPYQMKFALHEHHKASSLYWHPYVVLAAISGHKNIGACADIGHWVRSGLDVTECLRQLKGHILELHIKDIDVEGKDVDPGKGEINFQSVLGEMSRQQLFNAPAFIEYEQSFSNNVGAIKNERTWLENLFK
jgi:sugar phosphate isomerase/epimerase